jgi:magnesium-transporting ATPase (P-type)
MCKEPLEEDAMKRKPIKKGTSVFAFGLGTRVIIVAVLFTALAMTAYFLGANAAIGGLTPSHEIGRTMAYVTLGWASVINIMNVRSFKKSLFTIGFKSNMLLTGGICLSLSLLAITAGVPGIREVFHCVPVTGWHWLIMGIMGLTPLILVEILKVFWRRSPKTI